MTQGTEMMKTTLIGKVVTVSYWHEIYKPDEGTTRKTLKDIMGVLEDVIAGDTGVVCLDHALIPWQSVSNVALTTSLGLLDPKSKTRYEALVSIQTKAFADPVHPNNDA